MKMTIFKAVMRALLAAGLLTSPFMAGAAELRIVDENFDPPTLATPIGWGDAVVTDFSRKYVQTGVGGSTALEFSATLPSANTMIAATMFQSGYMGANNFATRDNTVLSFDLRIDSPGLQYIGVHLDGFAEYNWNWPNPPTFSGSVAPVDVRSFKPGVFKKVVLPLNDPLWMPVYDYSVEPPAPFPPFDPAARTYNNVTLLVNSYCLKVPGSFKVTVDNVQITTKSPMVPIKLQTLGYVDNSKEEPTLVEDGVAEHIGSFHQETVFTDEGLGITTITAANGDQLYGTLWLDWAEFKLFAVQINGGTGRFEGAQGSYSGRLDAASWTTEAKGGITSVGLSGKAK